MDMHFPSPLTTDAEQRLRSVLTACGKLAIQAVTDVGAPDEVLSPSLAKEYDDWIVFENGRYGTMPEGLYDSYVAGLSIESVQDELNLSARILDSFSAYEGVVQLAVERALRGDGEPA